MADIRIFLSHPSIWAMEELQSAVACTHVVAAFNCGENLTAAYNAVEHESPDFLIVDASLAVKPEFELLSALLKLMRVLCVIWGALD